MLTRETINSGAYLGSFGLPREVAWTQDQIEASLAETMRARPAGADVWVFAYGSLMWNPLLDFDRREIATLHGWRRSFCLRMTAGRGSPEVPGRMLALEAGGSTHGVALRLAAATLEEELRVLWIREMVTGSYLPTWAPLTLADGTGTAAIAFVANPARPQYEPDASVATVASIVAAASGAFGSNADYVLALECALSECALADGYIEALAAALRREAPADAG